MKRIGTIAPIEIKRRFEAEMERLQIIDSKFYFEIDLL